MIGLSLLCSDKRGTTVLYIINNKIDERVHKFDWGSKLTQKVCTYKQILFAYMKTITNIKQKCIKYCITDSLNKSHSLQ